MMKLPGRFSARLETAIKGPSPEPADDTSIRDGRAICATRSPNPDCDWWYQPNGKSATAGSSRHTATHRLWKRLTASPDRTRIAGRAMIQWRSSRIARTKKETPSVLMMTLPATSARALRPRPKTASTRKPHPASCPINAPRHGTLNEMPPHWRTPPMAKYHAAAPIKQTTPASSKRGEIRMRFPLASSATIGTGARQIAVPLVSAAARSQNPTRN